MRKEIEEMTNGSSKKLYHALWGNNEFAETLKIRKAPYRGSQSDNSYIFNLPDDKKSKESGLVGIFDIADRDRFSQKFMEACSGDGQEIDRITTLHSSSLCALLFFYNVSSENPLTLELDGNDVTFTDSFFEYRNTVIEDRNPSNMDVVLLGKQGDKKVILFLESKFSEYYQRVGKTLDISKAYLDDQIVSSAIYDADDFDGSLGIDRDTAHSNNDFRICSSERVYLEGIKQMISHYVGVYNFMTGKSKVGNCECKQRVSEFFDENTLVYLGEVVFDHKIGELPIGRGAETCLESYEKKYESLARIIKCKNEIGSRFKMVSHLMKYSSVSQASDHKFEENIMRFYFK